MDRLAAMQTFVRVVETGSFSAVAREQSTSQSGVSKQVAGLESYLGVRLLTRSTRALALTDEGRGYFTEARRLLAEITEAEAPLRYGGERLSGRLHVAAAVGHGMRVVMPHLTGFMQRHPAITVDIHLNDGLIDLVGHGIDVAIRVGELADSSVIARTVGMTARVVCASRDLVQRWAEAGIVPQHPDDLAKVPCVVYYSETTRHHTWAFNGPDGNATRVRVCGPVETNCAEVVRLSVASGVGVSYSPQWLFADLLASGEVVALLPHWQTTQVPLHLVMPPHRQHSSKVRAFVDYMASALKG